MIEGKLILLRKPKESDLIDYLNVEVSQELIRMYGGDTRDLSPKTKLKSSLKQFLK